MLFRALLAAVFCIAFPLTALAQQSAPPPPNPWYVQGTIGGFFRQDASGPLTIHRGPISAAGTNTSTFNPGVIGSLALGYDVANRIRLELEFDYATYTGNTISPFTADPNFPLLKGGPLTRQSGDRFSLVVSTLNAFYDFPVTHYLVPYLGGGIGAAYRHKNVGQF